MLLNSTMLKTSDGVVGESASRTAEMTVYYKIGTPKKVDDQLNTYEVPHDGPNSSLSFHTHTLEQLHLIYIMSVP